MKSPILKVCNLVTTFDTDQGQITPVQNITFELQEGKNLGIVGESGSGKSVTALSIMGLLPSKIGQASGEIVFNQDNLLELSEQELLNIRGNKISMIFQEPMTSLNPIIPIGSQIAEVLQIHQNLSKSDCKTKVIEILKQVGIPDPERRFNEYPHQLSGGMKQRVVIAMALICHPQILIADEPTTALDVTIQAQILELMRGLQKNFNTAIILITHDLSVVAENCDEVIVMYCGNIVEQASVRDLFKSPYHPYTCGLLASLPQYQNSLKQEKLFNIKGTIPSLFNLPEGCSFFDRCDYAQEKCRQESPCIHEIAPNHFVRCHYPQRG